MTPNLDEIRHWLERSSEQPSDELALEVAGALLALAATPADASERAEYLRDFLEDVAPAAAIAELIQLLQEIEAQLASGAAMPALTPARRDDVKPWVGGILDVAAAFRPAWDPLLRAPPNRSRLLPLLAWVEDADGVSALQLGPAALEDLRNGLFRELPALPVEIRLLLRSTLPRTAGPATAASQRARARPRR